LDTSIPWSFVNGSMFVRWYGTYFVFNVFALYIALVCKHGVKSPADRGTF